MRGLFLLFVLALAAVAPTVSLVEAAEQGIELRVFPEGPIYTYQLDPARRRSDIVLHNLGVISREKGAVTIEGIDFQLLRQGVVLQSSAIGPQAISHMARRHHHAHQNGVFIRFDSVFGFSHLFGVDGKLSGSRTLAENEGLILFQRYFVFSGHADTLRIVVSGRLEGGAALSGQLDVSVVTYQPKNSYIFPLEGPWFVNVGPSPSDHHRWSQSSEFALDAIRLGVDKRAFKHDGQLLEEFHAYGAAVRAAAAGVVVTAVDGIGAAPLKKPNETFNDFFSKMSNRQSDFFGDDPSKMSGNYVVVRHAGGEHSVYQHLQEGSVLVKPGEIVAQGQPLGRIGNSGNSLEPHLHFHVMAGPDPLRSRSVPVIFDNLAGRTAESLTRQLRSGDVVFAAPSPAKP